MGKYIIRNRDTFLGLDNRAVVTRYHFTGNKEEAAVFEDRNEALKWLDKIQNAYWKIEPVGDPESGYDKIVGYIVKTEEGYLNFSPDTGFPEYWDDLRYAKIFATEKELKEAVRACRDGVINYSVITLRATC
jgi:hypothetical protein